MSQILNESIQEKNRAAHEDLRRRIEALGKKSKRPHASLAERIAISSQVKLLEAEYDDLARSVWAHIPLVGMSTPL